MNGDDPTKLVIASDFPGPPEVGTADEGRDGWRLSRLWGGYPELEWTFGLFGERVKAFGGQFPAYFYEDVTDFDTARWLVRMGGVLVHRREPSYPSVGLGFEYLDSAYRVVDGRLVGDGSPFRGRHSVAAVDHGDMEEIKFLNSWDPPNWGDGGFGYVTREYFDRHVDAVHARWSASGGPSLALKRCMERAERLSFPIKERLVKCWPMRNVFWTQEVGTGERSFTMLNWDVFSVENGALVHVIEIRDENEVVGRAHLYHDDVTLAQQQRDADAERTEKQLAHDRDMRDLQYLRETLAPIAEHAIGWDAFTSLHFNLKQAGGFEFEAWKMAALLLVDQVGPATERLRRDGRVLVLLLGPEAEVPKWLHEMANDGSALIQVVRERVEAKRTTPEIAASIDNIWVKFGSDQARFIEHANKAVRLGSD